MAVQLSGVKLEDLQTAIEETQTNFKAIKVPKKLWVESYNITARLAFMSDMVKSLIAERDCSAS